MTRSPRLHQLLALGLAIAALAGCGTPSLVGSGTASNVQGLAHGDGSMAILVMPDMGVQPILDAIHGAKKTIRLETYMFTNHDLSARLIQALIERAHAGVDVQVILEANPYSPANAADPANTAANANQETMQALIAGGVRVKRSSPKFKYTHEKAMVIDGAVAYIMTLNFTNSAFTTNREYAVVDRSSSDINEVLRIFQADWNETVYTPQDPDIVVSPDNSRAQLLKLVDSAKKSLWVQTEYCTDPEMANHLGARVKAGVDVKVMLSFQPKDETTGYDTNTDELKLLNGVGVTQVHFVQSPKMHAKSMVVDDAKAFVGSENLTTNSLNGNREVGVLIRDLPVIGTILRTAKADWSK